MNTNGLFKKHWFHISSHFVLDTALFYAAFVLGIFLRFGGEDGGDVTWSFWPFLILGSLAFSSTAYINGLYSTHSSNKGITKRALVLGLCCLIAVGMVISMTYLDTARPLGRGVMLLGTGLSFFLTLIHHIFLLHALRSTRENVLYVVTCKFDEAETELFGSFGGGQLKLVGLVESSGYKAAGGMPVLGKAGELQAIVKREKVSRVLCTDRSLRDAELCRQFCQLRFSGITVMSLVSMCEEIDQYVPIELVTSEWLLNASGEPHQLYIKKIKRSFDVFVSLVGLLISLPLLLLSMLAVKLTSSGPVFYRQRRSGRQGRNFDIIKLRTMRADAEKEGAVWCAGKDDPRLTLIGGFLRKYRIDEIPQLVNVLMGQMSFVGPRPERPEMNANLAGQIPFYQERFMVQPGITGWAQVNYPYGASIQDARRKLEYDLYYMKHMSIFLDVFILLDTVRIVLRGGVGEEHEHSLSRHKAIHEWELARSRNESEPIEPTDIPLPSI
jgi:exopolysaccharide biosynthesis polyprenyl glycosylphosphotransferase